MKFWFVGEPAAVVIAGAVAFVMARETAPVAVATPAPVAAAAEPEVPIATRVDNECRKIVGNGTDLESGQALAGCKIRLLSQYLAEAKQSQMDDAYHRAKRTEMSELSASDRAAYPSAKNDRPGRRTDIVTSSTCAGLA